MRNALSDYLHIVDRLCINCMHRRAVTVSCNDAALIFMVLVHLHCNVLNNRNPESICMHGFVESI